MEKGTYWVSWPGWIAFPPNDIWTDNGCQVWANPNHQMKDSASTPLTPFTHAMRGGGYFWSGFEFGLSVLSIRILTTSEFGWAYDKRVWNRKLLVRNHDWRSWGGWSCLNWKDRTSLLEITQCKLEWRRAEGLLTVLARPEPVDRLTNLW